LDMNSGGLTGQEFVGEWYFNFSPVGNLSDLSFARITSPNPGTTTVSTSLNGFSAGGGGQYDILFDFPESISDGRFTSGLTSSYIISSVATLNSAMFDFLSSPQGGNGTFITAAHVQAIGPNASDSSFIAVPEPSTYLIMGSLLLAVGALSYWRKRARAN
jgi:hypothetical protein